MNNETERRHHERIPFIAEVLMSREGEEWSGVLLDISLKGLLLEPPSDVVPDYEGLYGIELVLGENAAITMKARLRHVNEAHWGLVWEHIDIEGLTHLRRLLELNIADADEVHRELSQLG